VVVGAEVLSGCAIGDDGIDEVVEVIVGSGEGVPVDEGGPVVPVATVVVVGRRGGVGDGGVSREVEAVDCICVVVHVYFHGCWSMLVGEEKRGENRKKVGRCRSGGVGDL